MADYPFYEVDGEGPEGSIAIQLTISEDGATIDHGVVVAALRDMLAAQPGIVGTNAYRVDVTSTELF